MTARLLEGFWDIYGIIGLNALKIFLKKWCNLVRFGVLFITLCVKKNSFLKKI